MDRGVNRMDAQRTVKATMGNVDVSKGTSVYAKYVEIHQKFFK